MMTNNVPKVTVLMPVYNAGIYLQEAIESILKQTFSDFELLIINDGSTDQSAEVIARFDDPRIRYVKNEKNIGLVKTLNKGLDLAQGIYVARMDQDDISLPERLEKQVKFLDTHSEIGVCGSWFELFPSGELVQRPVTNDEIKAHLFINCALGHPTVIIRMKVLKNNNLLYDPSFDHAEDYEFWTRLIQKTKMQNIPEVLLKYRVHSSQICSVYNDKQRDIVNLIRINQLHYLGIVPTEREKTIHLAALAESIEAEINTEELKAWIDKLIFANTQRKIYSEKEFSNMLNKCLEKFMGNRSMSAKRKTESFLKNIFFWKKK